VAVAVPVLVLMVSAAPKSSQASASGQACLAPASAPLPLPTTSSSPSSAEPAPEEILVCVGSESITGATYSHWATIARRTEGQASNKGLPPSTTETRTEALQFLITSDWVLGEARDLHIAVSAAQIKRQFDRVKAQQFRTRAQFEAFLRSSGEAVADLLFRVQLNMLSERIQRHVSAIDGGPRARQRALSRFVEAFKAKWMAQTYCAAEYAVQDCGHVQSVL
jgi:SurA N-terminal domain